MHEAFAAQTLSNVKMFASKQFAEEKLNRTQAIGEIDMDKFNLMGGSLHMVTHLLRQVHEW